MERGDYSTFKQEKKGIQKSPLNFTWNESKGASRSIIKKKTALNLTSNS